MLVVYLNSKLLINFRLGNVHGYNDGLVFSKTTLYSAPTGITIDSRNNLYIGDGGSNNVIRFIPTINSTVFTLQQNYGYGIGRGLAINPNATALYIGFSYYYIFYLSCTQGYFFSYGKCVATKITYSNPSQLYFYSFQYSQNYGAANLPSALKFDITQQFMYIVWTNANVIFKILVIAGTSYQVAPNYSWNQPTKLIVGYITGNVYVTDYSRVSIIYLSNQNTATLIAGTTTVGYNDGYGSLATFNNPQGIIVNANETMLYIADYGNAKIRQIVISTSQVTTFTVTGSYNPSCFGITIDYLNQYLYCTDPIHSIVMKINILTHFGVIFAGQCKFY